MPVFDHRIQLPEPVAKDVLQLLGLLLPLRTGLEETLEGIILGEMSTSERARRAPVWLLDLVYRNSRGLIALARMVGYTKPCFRRQQRALQDLFGLLSFFSHANGPSAEQFERFAHSSGVYFLQEIFKEIAEGLLANYDHDSLPIIIHNIAAIDTGPGGVVEAPGSHLAAAGPTDASLLNRFTAFEPGDPRLAKWQSRAATDLVPDEVMDHEPTHQLGDGALRGGPVSIWGNTWYYADGTVVSV